MWNAFSDNIFTFQNRPEGMILKAARRTTEQRNCPEDAYRIFFECQNITTTNVLRMIL